MASQLGIRLHCITLSIVEVCVNKITVNSVHEDDWTVELVIIASNAMMQPKEANPSCGQGQFSYTVTKDWLYICNLCS